MSDSRHRFPPHTHLVLVCFITVLPPFLSHSTNPSGSLVNSVRVFCVLCSFLFTTVLSGERVSVYWLPTFFRLLVPIRTSAHNNSIWRVGHLLLVALCFLLLACPVVSCSSRVSVLCLLFSYSTLSICSVAALAVCCLCLEIIIH